MVCRIYDESLTIIGILRNYISLVWEEEYNTVGVSQLVTTKNKLMRDTLKKGYFLGIDESKTLMRIHTAEEKNGQIWVYAPEAKKELENHILKGYYTFSGKIDIAFNKKFNTEILPKWFKKSNGVGIEKAVDVEKAYKDYGSIIQEMCNETDCGYSFIKDGDKLALKIYLGKKNDVPYSDILGNIYNVERTTSDVNYKNTAIVKYSDDLWHAVDLSNGKERREMLVEVFDQNYTGSLTAFLDKKGREALKETIESEEYTFDIKTDATMPELGDIIEIYLSEYNTKIEKRVTAISRRFEKNQKTIKITVGNPVLKGVNKKWI